MAGEGGHRQGIAISGSRKTGPGESDLVEITDALVKAGLEGRRGS